MYQIEQPVDILRIVHRHHSPLLGQGRSLDELLPFPDPVRYDWGLGGLSLQRRHVHISAVVYVFCCPLLFLPRVGVQG